MSKYLRTVLVLIMVLATAQISEAKPWYKSWKAWTVMGVSLGSSAAATHYSHTCRQQFGPAPCQGGYGPFKAREGLRFGLSAGLTAISLELRHQDDKVWPLIPIGFAAYNTSVAFRQSKIGCPAGQEFVYGTKFTCHKAD